MGTLFSKLPISKGLMAGLLLGTVIGSIGVAAATTSPSSTKFYACLNVKAGTMNSINTTGAPKCGKGNVGINWNAAGQQGIPGVQGAAGPQGAPATQPPDIAVQGAQTQTPFAGCAAFIQSVQTEWHLSAAPQIACSNIGTFSSGPLPSGINHYGGYLYFNWGSCGRGSQIVGADFVVRGSSYVPYSGVTQLNQIDHYDPYLYSTHFELQAGDKFASLKTCSATNSWGDPSFSNFSEPALANGNEDPRPIHLTYEPDLLVVAAP